MVDNQTVMSAFQIVQFAVSVVQELLRTKDPDEVVQAIEDMRAKFQKIDNDVDKLVANSPERQPINEK